MLNNFLKRLSASSALKSGVWYTIGNMFLKGTVFLTIPIFTRILTTDDYGIVNTYTAYLSVISIFIGASLHSTIANAKYEFTEELDEYISSILCLASILFCVVLIVSNIFINYTGIVILNNKFLFNCLIVQSFGEFIISLSLARLTIDYKYKEFLIISISSTVLNIILSIVFILSLFNNQAYLGRIGGGAIITVIFSFFLYIRMVMSGKVFINLSYWKFGLMLSLPLIPHSLSSIILAQFDRIMINNYVGSSAAGIYSFTYNIGMVLNVVWSSMNNAWVPWFYDKMNQEKYKEITTKSVIYVKFFTVISIGLVLIAPELIKILAPSQYWGGINLVVPIVLSGYFVFLYSFASNTEFYYKKTKFIALGSILSAILNIVLNIVYIPKYGYVAAAYTTLISYIALFIFHWIILKYIVRITLFKIKDFMFSTIFVCILSFIIIMLKDYIIIRYSMVPCIIILYVSIYNKQIKY